MVEFYVNYKMFISVVKTFLLHFDLRTGIFTRGLPNTKEF
jgi:hypothetical protein